MSNFKFLKKTNRKSFTLIELLVVLAIVAILSTVVIMTLNPAELLKQARDSTRLSDLSTLNTALAAYSADVTNGFMGTSTNIYISIPDTSPTCANLGLTPPTGWTYRCVSSTSTRLTNGQGWVPVNLSNISFGSPLSALPIDPTNTTSTGSYYTYVSGGSYQISSKFESQKYQPQAAKTNSYDPSLYVLGNNTNLAPFVGGLVGWWKFDEGSGATAADSSGWGLNAVVLNSPTWTTGKSGTALLLNGTSQYASSSLATSMSSYTWSVWMKTATALQKPVISNRDNVAGTLYLGVSSVRFFAYDSSCSSPDITSDPNSNDNNWHLITYIINRASNLKEYYVDGVNVFSSSAQNCYSLVRGQLNIGFDLPNGEYFPGTIDDVRIYNRALSATEVSALYNSTK